MCNLPSQSSNMNIISDLRKRANQNVLWGAREIRRFIDQAEKTKILREEHCCGATLHRGCYHPSPVYDLIVGNTKRGKLSNKSNHQLSHSFYFDCEDRLVRIEYQHADQLSHIEYLNYCGQSVKGITVDRNGFLSAVTEERYPHNRISFFSIVRCYHVAGGDQCLDYHEEEYHYDNLGLSKCHFVNFTPKSGYLVDRTYTFDRDNGFLVAFSPEPADMPPEQQSKYTIKKKRKA